MKLLIMQSSPGYTGRFSKYSPPFTEFKAIFIEQNERSLHPSTLFLQDSFTYFSHLRLGLYNYILLHLPIMKELYYKRVHIIFK
jgi:hypothetical protein